MGRPLNKKYFANTNINNGGIGGESVASVSVGFVGTGYTTGDVVTFSAPQLPGGVTATGTVVASAGQVDSITIVEAGSGYTSAPTVDLSAIGNGDATAGATLTNTAQNGIAAYAFVTGGSSKLGDIIKQQSSRRYKVQTADGTQVCKLVAAAPAAGEMTITATDSSGKTYYVTKLTAHKAELAPYGAAGHEWPTLGTNHLGDPIYQSVRWSFGAAVAIGSTNLDGESTEQVQIANN